MTDIIVSGSFDDLRLPQVRFLDAASRLGRLRVQLWSDDLVRRFEQHEPKFPQVERQYLVESLRYPAEVTLVSDLPDPNTLADAQPEATWALKETDDTPARREFASAKGLHYRVIDSAELNGYPQPGGLVEGTPDGRKKVLVTGCYDWLHSGHLRFFEEVAQLGDLYVVVGNDANVRFLKGEGHPLFNQEHRRYMVQAVRFVKQALISTGMGWMDAEPQIAQVQPHIYAVNEDGDKPEKRAFCAEHDLEYVVLKRLPKEGLPRRESTRLRGF